MGALHPVLFFAVMYSFAGQDGEAGIELEHRVLDDDEIANGNALEHSRSGDAAVADTTRSARALRHG